MIKSMTGYGRAELAAGDRNMVVEVRSYNHRYRDVSSRVPGKLYALENQMVKFVSSHIARGRVEVSVQVETPKEEPDLTLNLPFVRKYYDLLCQLKGELNLSDDIHVSDLIGNRNAVLFGPEEDVDLNWKLLRPALTSAIKSLNEMRKAEGANIYKDFKRRVNALKRLSRAIERRAASRSRTVLKKMRKRIEELCQNMEIDEGRVAQEVAYLAERSDISEELVRIQSHIGQFEKWLEAEGPVGRKLDFLMQEINREVNTVGTKAGDANVSLKVVALKNELEKIREQVQNVE
jgi:uncharacterized protein (TIGR00255 family)